MKRLIGLFLILGLVTLGCVQEEAPPIDQSVVPTDSDALSGPAKSNETIRGLTGDNCGSYVTYNGLSDSEAELLGECYENKYLNPAIAGEDTSICDEIYNPYEYGACYGLVAAELEDSSMCDGIVNILFERRSGPDDATTIDACKFTYIGRFVYMKRQMPDITCDELVTGDYQGICEEAINTIKPPTRVGSLWIDDDTAPNLSGYIILQDSEGETQVADGTLTISVTTETGRELYTKVDDVEKSEFAWYILGSGVFEREDFIYVFSGIDLSNVQFSEDECSYGDCDLEFTATFDTDDGDSFSLTEEEDIDSGYFSVRDNSECLIISELKDELVDESTEYSIRKYFVVSGKVTNECGATKEYVKVTYIFYNSDNVVLLEDFHGLNPSTIPPGYTIDFENRVMYEGSYVDIVEIPDHYTVVADT